MSDIDARWLLENSSGWFDPDCENVSRHEDVTVAVDADASLPYPVKVRWADGAIGADYPDSFVRSFALLGPDVLAVVTRLRERLAAVDRPHVGAVLDSMPPVNVPNHRCECLECLRWSRRKLPAAEIEQAVKIAGTQRDLGTRTAQSYQLRLDLDRALGAFTAAEEGERRTRARCVELEAHNDQYRAVVDALSESHGGVEKQRDAARKDLETAVGLLRDALGERDIDEMDDPRWSGYVCHWCGYSAQTRAKLAHKAHCLGERMRALLAAHPVKGT